MADCIILFLKFNLTSTARTVYIYRYTFQTQHMTKEHNVNDMLREMKRFIIIVICM